MVVALGGNAIATSGNAGPQAQRQSVETAMEHVAELIGRGYQVAITHGNGPQVGNLLLKNELAKNIVPAVPLDWCVAQTQATIGYLITTALERALAAKDLERAIVVVLTRVLVDPGDPAFLKPTKPIGRDRRLVPSPEPMQILDEDAIVRLLDDGAVVIAAGGGGIPMVREDGGLRGIEAVIDKDLCSTLLARVTRAHSLVIATDVQGVAADLTSSQPRWLRDVSVGQLRELRDEGRFPPGSMGPKVEACLRFVEAGGRQAAIGPLDRLSEVAAGEAGTIVRADTR